MFTAKFIKIFKAVFFFRAGQKIVEEGMRERERDKLQDL